MNRDDGQRPLGLMLTGRCFVNPLFDYLLIGGGLSLVTTAILVTQPIGTDLVRPEMLPVLILLSNSVHFAASTVRLYTKPGTRQTLPFLTTIFPLVAFAVLTLCIILAEAIGPHLQAMYLTWSPYHYAAQAYGLAVMYSYRAGCSMSLTDKRLLWWVSMLPFFYMFVSGANTGLQWLLPVQVSSLPAVASGLNIIGWLLTLLAFAAPVVLFAKIWSSPSGPMPLISLLMVASNAIWWFVLSPLDAFVWATIFHGVQYIAIVIIFHVKDQVALPDNRHSVSYHVVWFYGACLLLGYGLFNCLPFAYVLAGFGEVESILLVAAAINVHHFIVDAYIWRLKKTDSNRTIVDSGELAPA